MKNKWILLVVLLAIIVFSILIGLKNINLTDNLFEKAGAVFVSLFLIALFIERGLDVFLTNLRASESEKIQNRIEILEVNAASQPDLGSELENERNLLHDYKSKTRFYAMRTSLIIGILVSAIGFRSLQNLIDPTCFDKLESFQKYIIYFFDIFLTGAVLAGGSDSIHKMMNAFRLFMEKK